MRCTAGRSYIILVYR